MYASNMKNILSIFGFRLHVYFPFSVYQLKQFEISRNSSKMCCISAIMRLFCQQTFTELIIRKYICTEMIIIWSKWSVSYIVSSVQCFNEISRISFDPPFATKCSRVHPLLSRNSINFNDIVSFFNIFLSNKYIKWN